MSAFSRHKFLLIGAVIVAALALYFLRRESPTMPPSPQAPGSLEAQAKDIEVGDYYDWSSYDGPLRKDVTNLLAETLFEKSERGYDVSRLASDARFENGKATVMLRESARWSDGVPLASNHVVDAFDRAKLLGFAAKMQDVVLKANGPREVIVEGLKDKDEMSALLQGRVLMPIRSDLIAAQGKEAFRVTIGPYVPTQIVRTFKSDASLVLEPNPYYYRGAKGAPLSLGVAALVAAQKEGG